LPVKRLGVPSVTAKLSAGFQAFKQNIGARIHQHAHVCTSHLTKSSKKTDLEERHEKAYARKDLKTKEGRRVLLFFLPSFEELLYIRYGCVRG